jgi:hypothetical protein
MAKACSSCGLTVNDAALFCEKCGYRFANDQKASIPSPQSVPNKAVRNVVLSGAGITLLACVVVLMYVVSSQTSTPRQSAASERQQPFSAEDRAKVIHEWQDEFKHGAVSEQGQVLIVKHDGGSNVISLSVLWGLFRQRLTNAGYTDPCKGGFRQVRFDYLTLAATYSLGCGSDIPSEVKQLALIAHKWRNEYGYAIMEGQVMNISQRPLDEVEAVATFYDETGGFITSHDAIIEYNPIRPYQISPFKVATTYNPDMKKANVEFKYLVGGSIPLLVMTEDDLRPMEG